MGDFYNCRRPPIGWKCTRAFIHDGPCAAVPRWWNMSRFAWKVRRAARR